MELVVSDANIFIDLEIGGLIEQLFELPWTVVVPDALFRDELADQHPELLGHGLEQRTLSGDSITRIIDWNAAYSRTSRYDLMALSLAVQESCTLLTGDSDLRKAATSENVDVHGTLWVIRCLFDGDIIEASEVATAYTRMKQASRRLPWNLVRDQLAELGVVVPDVLK